MGRPSDRARESRISVTMESDLIVVRPHGDLDRSSTETFVAVIDAASRLGAAVHVSFDGEPVPAATPAPMLEPVRSSLVDHSAPEGGPAEVIGPGRVRLRSSASWWTIDVGRRRVCHSARPLDSRFVAPECWTSIRSLTVEGGRVSVITEAGRCLSIAATWCRPSDSSSSPLAATPVRQRPRLPAA